MTETQMNTVLSSMIFDQLTHDFKIRKEAIVHKLEEIGFKCSLTELLGLDLFVGTNTATANRGYIY